MKICFSHDAAYANNKDLTKKTVPDKILKDKAYQSVLNPKYDGYQKRLASLVYKLFDPSKIESGPRSKVRTNVNKVLAQKFNQWLKNSKKEKCMQGFKDNIWAANIAKLGSLSSMNRGVKYLLCVIDVFTKYAWVKSLKDTFS